MKILMVVHGFAPECQGGTESYVQNLALRLKSKGHEVEIFCGSHEGAGPEFRTPRVVSSVHEGLPVHRVHRAGLFNDAWEKSLAPDVANVLTELLRTRRFDLVHVHHWIRLTRNLIETCHAVGVPAVATLHDLWTSCPIAFRVKEQTFCRLPQGAQSCFGCAPLSEPGLADAAVKDELDLFGADLRSELSLARRLIVPSVAHREELLRHFPELTGRFRVVPHGKIAKISSRDRSKEQIRPGRLRIAHWGHLSKLKGVDLLLRALHLLPDKSQVQVDLFGELVYPTERAEVESLLEGLNVKMRGAYTTSQLASYQHDLAIIPSRCSESWSFVLDEAFLIGLPVLVPDGGALPDPHNGAGGVFRAESAEDLARLIQEVLDQPELITKWRARIPSLPVFEDHTQDILRHYHEVVSSQAALPQVSRELESRRLQVRTRATESLRRSIEIARADARNAGDDLARAQSAMAEMQHFHLEKDKEIQRLQSLALQASAQEELARARAELAEVPALRDQLRRARLEIPELMDRLFSSSRETSEARNQQLALKLQLDAALERATALQNELSALRDRKAILRASLEVKAADLRADQARQIDLDVRRQRTEEATRGEFFKSLTAERAASRHLLSVLEEERRRLAHAEQENASLATRIESVGSKLSAAAKSAAIRLQHDLDPATASGASPQNEGGFLNELLWAEREVHRLLEHAASREQDLRTLLVEREASHRREQDERTSELTKLARNLDHVLETLQNVERQRLGRLAARPGKHKKRPGERLKVLMVVHQFLPRHVAGTEIYTHNLARELSNRHDVVILSAESDHSKSRFDTSIRHLGPLKIHQYIHNYAWTGFRDQYDCPEADAIFRHVLAEERPDVVHIQHLHYGSANFVTIAKARGIPVVFTLHDYWLLCPRDGQMRRADGEVCVKPAPEKCRDCIGHLPIEAEHAPLIPRALRPGASALVAEEAAAWVRRARLHVPLELGPHAEASAERLDYLRRVAKDVDLFIAPSGFLKDVFASSGLIPADKILVSDNGYAIADFRPLPREKDLLFRVGYVGSIAEHKGIHVLIEAMNRIRDPRITCQIWGDLSSFAEYTDRLRGAIQNPRIALMGPYTPERSAEVLSRLDLLVIPSLWYENAPLTIREAALAGLPVLASDLGALPENIIPGKTGALFPVGDAAALATSIERFASDPTFTRDFDPRQFPVKSIQGDARDMESRYFTLLDQVPIGPV